MNLLQRIRAKLTFQPTDNACAPCAATPELREGAERIKQALGRCEPHLELSKEQVARLQGLRMSFGAPGLSERQHQARAREFVRRQGSITLKDIRDWGCNHPSKVVFRLREEGLVLPKQMDTWWNNGKGRFKRYHYTGASKRRAA